MVILYGQWILINMDIIIVFILIKADIDKADLLLCDVTGKKFIKHKKKIYFQHKKVPEWYT